MTPHRSIILILLVALCLLSISRNYVTIPQGVYVNDTSSGSITRRNWSWGDMTANSTSLSATHNYRSPGYFIVNLESCNSFGCNQTHRVVFARFGDT